MIGGEAHAIALHGDALGFEAEGRVHQFASWREGRVGVGKAGMADLLLAEIVTSFDVIDCRPGRRDWPDARP
ncbi:hypothetical protein TUM20286_07310 [Pseudomonas tohonis]|uniref:Uncharacterized protein n=1 Tax=Pseudomonas tohonis TaxID=2725477 RepID=A0ABQ4VU37_9PSED|nr:hypothetical protein TUM20286_07310 [Pseudomonas tohonis]